MTDGQPKATQVLEQKRVEGKPCPRKLSLAEAGELGARGPEGIYSMLQSFPPGMEQGSKLRVVSHDRTWVSLSSAPEMQI